MDTRAHLVNAFTTEAIATDSKPLTVVQCISHGGSWYTHNALTKVPTYSRRILYYLYLRYPQTVEYSTNSFTLKLIQNHVDRITPTGHYCIARSASERCLWENPL